MRPAQTERRPPPRLCFVMPVCVFADEDGEDGAGPTGVYDEEEDEDEDGSESAEAGLGFQVNRANQVSKSSFILQVEPQMILGSADNPRSSSLHDKVSLAKTLNPEFPRSVCVCPTAKPSVVSHAPRH